MYDKPSSVATCTMCNTQNDRLSFTTHKSSLLPAFTGLNYVLKSPCDCGKHSYPVLYSCVSSPPHRCRGYHTLNVRVAMEGTDCDTNTVYDFFIRSQRRKEVSHGEMIEEAGGFDMHSLLQRPRLKDLIAGLSESCLIPHKVSTHL